jgi:hypothetical protein
MEHIIVTARSAQTTANLLVSQSVYQLTLHAEYDLGSPVEPAHQVWRGVIVGVRLSEGRAEVA